MAIEILDKSKVTEGTQEANRIDCTCKLVLGNAQVVPAGKILRCERIELGVTSNCSLCQNVNKELFLRCRNKWTYSAD
jgi:hypothetical protein